MAEGSAIQLVARNRPVVFTRRMHYGNQSARSDGSGSLDLPTHSEAL
jgi:hypothetical protein